MPKPPDEESKTGATADHPLAAQMLREGISAFISLAIVAVSLWLLVDTYHAGKVFGGDDEKVRLDAFARQKDLLLYALGLLGTVTGYYFGRVPAELHAHRAEGEAKASRNQAEHARDSERNLKRKIRERVRGSRRTTAASNLQGDNTLADELEALLDEIE